MTWWCSQPSMVREHARKLASQLGLMTVLPARGTCDICSCGVADSIGWAAIVVAAVEEVPLEASAVWEGCLYHVPLPRLVVPDQLVLRTIKLQAAYMQSACCPWLCFSLLCLTSAPQQQLQSGQWLKRLQVASKSTAWHPKVLD